MIRTVLILLFSTVCAFGQSYTTTFPEANQNPLSQGGLWINGKTTGIDWNDMQINGHVAYGNGAIGSSDDTAVLSGSWGTNQIVKAKIHVTYQGGTSPEIELRLRTTITANSITGYEINYSAMTQSGRYFVPVRWNGPNGNFTVLGGINNGPVLAENDELEAIAYHSTLYQYLNGTLYCQTNDTTYLGGAPGIGGDQNGSLQNGFKNFSAVTWNSGTTWYVRRGGSDSNAGLMTNLPGGPFLTYAHAASVAQTGDIIDVDFPWYVDNHATGANNGTSWTDAWTNFSNIGWSSIHAGDTLNISGGPSGGINIYTNSISDQLGSPNPGTKANPISVKPGGDPLHNGLVKILAGMFVSRNYWVIDGRKQRAVLPNTVWDTFFVGTNCNIEIFSTNNTSAVQMFGTGSKCLGVHVAHMSSSDDTCIAMVDQAGRPIGDGSEVAYNWVSHGTGYALRGEFSTVVSNTFGQLSVHHNLIEGVNDNFMQYPGWVDVYKNVGRNHVDPDVGHPDVIQEVNVFSRMWNNIFYNFKGSRFYVEANNPLSHDILAWNNIWFSSAGWYGHYYTNVSNQVITNNPGTGFDFTGHDANPGTECSGSNIWYFNNTIYNRGTLGTPQAFNWSSGSSANPRSPMTMTNVGVWNNCIIDVAPFDNLCSLQFPTNLTLGNDSTGFLYSTNGVQVDYNSMTMATSKGQGIMWGPGGQWDLSNQYTNMAEFALRTLYKSNNNVTATFTSLPLNKYYTNLLFPLWEFRPQIGDTALVGHGTNLTSVVAAIAPESTNDISGVSRGTAWTIGAFQIDPTQYWVATNGNDGNAGTFAAPWRTIQHAVNVLTNGNVANVTPGDYNEYVTTPDNLTAAGASYTLRAWPANDPANPVITRQFRILHKNVTLEGFKVTKPFGINGSHIRVEPPNGSGRDGSGVVITNCTLADGVLLKTTTASFGSNFIHITSAVEGVNFNNAGFVPGGQVFMGSDSLRPYTNCGPANAANAPTVLSNSADGLTMYFANSGMVPFAPDPGTNYFAMIIAGNNGPGSWKAITFPVGSGGFPAASNIVVAGCTFSNLIGVAIDLGPCYGTNVVDGNFVTALHGGYMFNLNASNVRISNNFLKDSYNVEYFAADELSNTNLHPSGGQYYDWQCNLSIGNWPGQTNIWIYHNWFQGAANEMWETDPNTASYGILFDHDVFIGISQHGSENMDATAFTNCTFVRTAYSQKEAIPFAIGGTLGTPLKDGLVVNCAFVNNGGHFNLSQEVPFGILPGFYTNFWATNNYSIFSETMGWSNTPVNTWTNLAGNQTGVITNSGDPLFLNILQPLGPDGIPFTDDDGLRPLPNSILVTRGIGALTAPAPAAPIAHFTLQLPSPGWKDLTGTNYSPAWMALTPDQRTDDIRPWGTPEALGSNSVTAALDASNSLDGNGGLVNTAITNYSYRFDPEGTTQSTNSPYTTHAFTFAGTNTVTLTVTANGNTSTFSNSFRLLGNGASDPIITSQPASQSIYAGQNATFSVSASGTATIHFYWKFNGNPVGTDSPSFTTNAVLIGANGGAITVLVSNSVGQVTSTTATLSVTPDPHISVQPQDQSVSVGNTATFTVSADGASALHYQWKFKGVNVGSDSASYARANCQLSDSGGVVQVRVSDNAFLNFLDSSAAVLTVTGGPAQFINHVGKGHVGLGSIQ